MRFVKRIFVFALINILIIVTISTVMSLLNVRPYLNANGLDYEQLAIFCAIWGMGGAFISLGISRMMAKWMMGVKVIKEPRSQAEIWLVSTVHQMARRSGIEKMPEVGIYESHDINAFATGPTKNRALVAVSSGLLNRLDKNAVEGVLGHEVAHIANGDMVTMTLVQGVMNAFVMFFARVISYFLSSQVKEENRHWVNFIATIVLEIFLSFLAMFVVAYVSRMREFRADAGGAKLAGRDKMIGALEGLKKAYDPAHVKEEAQAHPAIASLKISGRQGGLLSLLSTHPALDERIARLRA
jgi:heat shock protein HtpX